MCTDNGSNFVKAFRIFSEETDQDEEESGIDFVELEPILVTSESCSDILFHLPKRQQCAGVNFINILLAHFLYRSVLGSFSLNTVWLCIFMAQNLIVKC